MGKYIFYKSFRFIMFPIFKFLFRPVIINASNIPEKGSAIIAGNHKNALDPILVDVCTKRVVCTLAKKSLHDGLFGFFFRAVGSIPVDTKGGSNKGAMDVAINKLNEGYLINLSPEGTRNRTKDLLLPFKYGAVSMAKKTNCVIVPYSITGDYKLFSKNLKIVFGKPMNVCNLEIDKANEKLFNNIKKLMIDNMDKDELRSRNIVKYRGVNNGKRKNN